MGVVVKHPDEFWPESRIERLLASPPVRGPVVDISMTGIACTLPQRLEPGAQVYLRVSGQRAGSQVDAQGSVLRSMPASGNQWLTVCTLNAPLGLHQIDLVRDQIDAARFV